MESRSVKRQPSLIEEEIEEAAALPVWNWRRTCYRGLTTGSILLNTLFAFFLYQSITKVRDATLKEFGEEDAAWASALLTLLAIYFAFTNFLGDPPSVNPIEDSENLLKKIQTSNRDLSDCSLALTKINTFLAIPSFAHFAAHNAIAVAGLSSNNRSFYLGLGIPFTLFSVLHQYVLSKNSIEDHSQRFVSSINNLTTRESFLLNILKAPLRSLEVAIESFSYVASQGIAAGYIADQLNKVLDLDEKNTVVMPWIITATFLTAYVTTFLKVLPAYNNYFNPAFDTLTAEDLKKIKLPTTDLLLNGGIALTRALSLAWLYHRFGPEDSLKKRLLLAGISSGSFLHPFYTLYQKQKYEAALEQRRIDTNYLYLIDPDQSQAELAEATPASLFDKIAAYYETRSLKKKVSFINVSARIGQLLSFIGFVAEVLKTMEANGYVLPFNFKDTLALAILWGTPIVIIEGRANDDPLVKTAAYHQAKYRIGAPTEKLAHKNVLTRMVAGFFYSKDQYARPRLLKALRSLEAGEDEERMGLVS